MNGAHCVSWSLSRPCAATGTLLYWFNSKMLPAILVLMVVLMCLLV